jgi:SrtB family sortase
MASKKRKLWMLPTSAAMMAGGLLCIASLLISMQFSMPEKPQISAETVDNRPMLDRSTLAYVPPKEVEEVKEEKEDFIYTFGVDVNKVRSAAAGNSNIIGWIRIPDTPINYPVMQCGDNQFYMHHDASGRSSFAGAIYADYRCNVETSDNTLIYGHNMGNGGMFHAIKNYKDKAWGDAHRYFELTTLNHRYLYRVLSCNVIFGEKGSAFEYWNYINMNRGEMHYYFESVHNTPGTWYGDGLALPRDNDTRLLCLQTCNSGAADGMRCCLFAELVCDGTNITQYSEKQGFPGYRLPAVEAAP